MVVGVSFAAFTDKAAILGSVFSVGSADLKLLDVIGGGVTPDNLLEEKPGPVFSDVSSAWVADYPIQLYNNSAVEMLLTSNAFYETANDPDELRQLIFVEPLEWVDADADGVPTETELGSSLGVKTIVKWKTEGFDLGSLAPGTVGSWVLRFSTASIPESKQGSSATFDFEFDSVGM